MNDFTVTTVTDGDTFKVYPRWESHGHIDDRVRIYGIDTPEMGERGYEEAKRRLTDLIEGRTVQLSGKAIDKFGRLVADVFLNGENVVNLLTTRAR